MLRKVGHGWKGWRDGHSMSPTYSPLALMLRKVGHGWKGWRGLTRLVTNLLATSYSPLALMLRILVHGWKGWRGLTRLVTNLLALATRHSPSCCVKWDTDGKDGED